MSKCELNEQFDEAVENLQSTLQIVKEVHNKGGVLEYNETHKSYIIGTKGVEKILNALERNEPMKIKQTSSEQDFSLFDCPNCETTMYYESEPHDWKYCIECGQKLDWSEDNDDDDWGDREGMNE